MAVSLAISEIFIIKEWPDLEISVGIVQGHWKLRCSTDNIQLSCTIF